MKTNLDFTQKKPYYILLGIISLVITSCGSYQNKSYYDNDGIYGTEAKKEVAVSSDNKYKEYFSTLNKENEEIMTDVESYTTYKDTTDKSSKPQQYDSWGSNTSDNVTVNVYDNNWGWNNYWGMNNWAWNSWYGPNWGWGWNSWYGSNWGWGWNSWYGPGWGWNNWYGNPYWCGNGLYNNFYGNGYAYANGPRQRDRYGRIGDVPSTRVGTVTPTRNTYNTSPRNNISNPREYNSVRTNGTREYTSPRNNTSNPREYTPTRSNSTTPRESTTPRTNSAPRSYESPRSNSSFGGGGGGVRSSGGGGGGGRSSGGGGRR